MCKESWCNDFFWKTNEFLVLGKASSARKFEMGPNKPIFRIKGTFTQNSCDYF